jgi:hypothetical protein
MFDKFWFDYTIVKGALTGTPRKFSNNNQEKQESGYAIGVMATISVIGLISLIYAIKNFNS